MEDLEEFKNNWHAWYLGMMPTWRAAGIKGAVKWPLSRNEPAGEEWGNIRKGERNGIVTLIMTLWWWKEVSMDNESARAHKRGPAVLTNRVDRVA